MGEVGKRFLGTIRMEHSAFVWMDLNDRASGDALILVAITQVLLFAGILGGLGSILHLGLLELLIRFVFGGLIQWLVYAGVVWAIVRYVIQTRGDYAFYLRATGFAFPTRLLIVAAVVVFDRLDAVAFIIGSVWFLAIVVRSIQYESDLAVDRAWFVAVGALAGVVVLNAIFGFDPLF